MLPCLIFEDDHVLVINKPAGWNTHAPDPHVGEGLFEWLRGREPRWEHLAIIHRLDKETSGLLVFAKTPLANRSLTSQFTQRAVRKKYVLLTDRPVPGKPLHLKSTLVRAGARYLSRPVHAGADLAETRFRAVPEGDAVLGGYRAGAPAGCRLVEAQPLTGRTHQIRVHAAALGFPVFGDSLYGGTPAPRVCLHAAELGFRHPVTGKELDFRAAVDFAADSRLALRKALLDPEATNICRLIHGASDLRPGWYVDLLADFVLSQSEAPLAPGQREELLQLMAAFGARGAYHKRLARRMEGESPAAVSPQLALGESASPAVVVRENRCRFELSFQEGYSVGLFLDQRDNRRRLLTGYVAPGFYLPWRSPAARPAAVLNAFAYTCGFSLCAALGGATATSLDLSKKYLDWGRRNFAQNQLDSARHDFIFGDVFDWCKRLRKKRRSFDVILLDPPTFSRSKESGLFRAERDYRKLVAAVLPLLNPGAVLFASTNAAEWPATRFIEAVEAAVSAGGRQCVRRQYVPQPPDFPVSRAEPAYLKTLWLQLD